MGKTRRVFFRNNPLTSQEDSAEDTGSGAAKRCGRRAHRGGQGAGDGARDTGPVVHAAEADELLAGEEAHLDGLAQDDGQVAHRAEPLRQYRFDCRPAARKVEA